MSSTKAPSRDVLKKKLTLGIDVQGVTLLSDFSFSLHRPSHNDQSSFDFFSLVARVSIHMPSMRASINHPPFASHFRVGAFKLPYSTQTKCYIIFVLRDQELSSYHASSSCRKKKIEKKLSIRKNAFVMCRGVVVNRKENT